MKGAALLVWIGLAGVASFALFNITFKVEQLEGELNKLHKAVLMEQKAVHELRAEWSYLNRPDRIEALVRKLLPGLGYPDASQIGGLDQLSAPQLTVRATTIGAGGTLRADSIRSKP